MTTYSNLDRALSILARLVADGPMGHKPQPITRPEDVELVRRANTERFSDEPGRSERWWCCMADNDKPVEPFKDPDGRRWGDVFHDRWQAYIEAKALLNETLDNGSYHDED